MSAEQQLVNNQDSRRSNMPPAVSNDEIEAPRGHRNVPSYQAIYIIERHNGRTYAHAWLDSFNTLAELHGWADAVCLRVARVRMTGPAQRWIHRRNVRDWDDFQERFTTHFGETRETAVARLSHCFQRPNESPKACADRFLEDAERAGRVEDEALVYQFLRQMRPALRKEAARRQPHSIDEIVSFCNYWQGAMNDDPDWDYDRENVKASNDAYDMDDDEYSFRPRRQPALAEPRITSAPAASMVAARSVTAAMSALTAAAMIGHLASTTVAAITAGTDHHDERCSVATAATSHLLAVGLQALPLLLPLRLPLLPLLECPLQLWTSLPASLIACSSR